MVEGILISPEWDRKSFSKLHELVKDVPLLYQERFVLSRPWVRVDASSEELIKVYGGTAIKKAKKVGERIKANLAFLYYIRGMGELKVIAHYFSLQK